MTHNDKITITEAARRLGIVPKTIIRWEQAGKIRKAKRDWRNWRVYTSDDLESMKEFYETLH